MKPETYHQEISETENTAAKFLEARLRLIDQVFNSTEIRQKLIDKFTEKIEQTPPEADAVIVLGTSLQQFPDKFNKRVYWGTHFVLKHKAPLIIFTGLQDDEAEDVNQAEDALNLATTEFNLNPDQGYVAGGNNSQENFVEAGRVIREHKLPVRSAYVVSDARHLIRSIQVGQHELSDQEIQLYPAPYDLHLPLQPDDPRVILELVKMIAYHHTLYSAPKSLTFEEMEKIQSAITTKVAACRKELKDRNDISVKDHQTLAQWLEEAKEQGLL